MAVMAYKLDLIANELEQQLSEGQPQDIFDQTIYSVCEVLFQINNCDLTGMCVPLKTLAELHPDLASNISLSIANAGLLHVMKHDEDPAVLLEKFKEEFGDNFLIASILRKYRYCRERAGYMEPFVKTLTQALLKNVTQCVRSILSPGRQHGNSSGLRPPPFNMDSSFVDMAPSDEDMVTDSSDEEMETALEGSSFEIFESLQTISDSKQDETNHRVANHHVSLTRCHIKLDDDSDIEERESTERIRKDVREGMESDHEGGESDHEGGESDIDGGESEEEGDGREGEESGGREGGGRGKGVGDEGPSDSMNSTMLSLNGRLEHFSPHKRILQISSESELSSNDSFIKVNLDPMPAKRQLRRNNLWSLGLTQKLIDGVNRLGVGNWTGILTLKKFPSDFNNNTLRYKWKNLVKYNHITRGGGKWVMNNCR